MSNKVIRLVSNLSVVWDIRGGITTKLYDMQVNTTAFQLEPIPFCVNVEGTDTWILTREDGRSKLMHYGPAGDETQVRIAFVIDSALHTRSDVPAEVWARAVSEAHKETCNSLREDLCCDPVRGQLAARGLLA